jgi:hypothetical protein
MGLLFTIVLLLAECKSPRVYIFSFETCLYSHSNNPFGLPIEVLATSGDKVLLYPFLASPLPPSLKVPLLCLLSSGDHLIVPVWQHSGRGSSRAHESPEGHDKAVLEV